MESLKYPPEMCILPKINRMGLGSESSSDSSFRPNNPEYFEGRYPGNIEWQRIKEEETSKQIYSSSEDSSFSDAGNDTDTGEECHLKDNGYCFADYQNGVDDIVVYAVDPDVLHEDNFTDTDNTEPNHNVEKQEEKTYHKDVDRICNVSEHNMDSKNHITENNKENASVDGHSHLTPESGQNIVNNIISNDNETEIEYADFVKEAKEREHLFVTSEVNKEPVVPQVCKDLVCEAPKIDPEINPQIESIKRFLLEGLPGSKQNPKVTQRSFSVPQSPTYVQCHDNNRKSSMSFEDLNLSDIVDLVDTVTKEGKSFDLSNDVPLALTEEDVDGFFNVAQPKVESIIQTQDANLTIQELELEYPLKTQIKYPSPNVVNNLEHKENKSSVLDYCIEKIKPQNNIEIVNIVQASLDLKTSQIKFDSDDFVDVESIGDNTALPVLEATNITSLLEQFEQAEKLNKISSEETKCQIKDQLPIDIQRGLNVNKMAVNNSRLHDNMMISTSSKGQSLLKPEVLNLNNEILKSRHRSCKNKKIVYNASSDEESNDKKPIVKTNTKSPVCTSFKKKMQSNKNVKIESNNKTDNRSNKTMKKIFNMCNKGKRTNGGLILKIKSQSKATLKIDGKDSKKPMKTAVINDPPIFSVGKVLDDMTPKNAKVPIIVKSECQSLAPLEQNIAEVVDVAPAKEFYTTLFNNTQDVTLPTVILSDTLRSEVKEEDNMSNTLPQTIIETKPLKKKLNIEEYRKRLEGTSNPSSRTVSPEAIFPDIKYINEKVKVKSETSPNLPSPPLLTKVVDHNVPKKIFDPIKEASRKILLHSQKLRTKRKEYEENVLSKIPKVTSLDIKPLMTDEEMMKMVNNGGLAAGTERISTLPPQKKQSKYEELTVISMGVNTDEKVFQFMTKLRSKELKFNETVSHKSGVNFIIKTNENISKQNVFACKTLAKNIKEERCNGEDKFDKNRYKDIAATIKSVGNNADLKVSSNSLFASIQDIVMKKTSNDNDKKSGLKSPIEQKRTPTKIKTSIIRQYEPNEEHGENKVINYLNKDRLKPSMCSVAQQTVMTSLHTTKNVYNITSNSEHTLHNSQKSRPVSDYTAKTTLNGVAKTKTDSHKISNSKERRDKYRHRSHSRNRPEKRTFSRSRSGSVDRYRSKHSYRRSDSSFRKTKRTTSPYSMTRLRSRSRSRSRSGRTEYNSQRHHETKHARTPPPKKVKISPEYMTKTEKVEVIPEKKMESPLRTQPLRSLAALTESSDSSSSSSSSTSPASSSSPSSFNSSSSRQKSTSSASSASSKSSYMSQERGTSHSSVGSDYRRQRNVPLSMRENYRSYSTDDSTPIEERRIVFVGKLDKSMTKDFLRSQFARFGQIRQVRLHNKSDGSCYGFVTFEHARDAWSAVEAASSFPNYDVGFGGRRLFCGHRYADLDGLEVAKNAYYGHHPRVRNHSKTFEDLLFELKTLRSKKNGT